VGRAWRLPVDEHAESYGGSRCCWPHDEVKIAGVETVGDLPIGGVQRGGLFLDRPAAGQRPVVEPQFRRGGVEARPARQDAARRGEVLGAVVAGVVFR
jgi:hypothetical protein